MAFPLHALKYATVDTRDKCCRLSFVMEDVQRESLGPYSDQDGQREAAHAVNQFLGVEIKP